MFNGILFQNIRQYDKKIVRHNDDEIKRLWKNRNMKFRINSIYGWTSWYPPTQNKFHFTKIR